MACHCLIRRHCYYRPLQHLLIPKRTILTTHKFSKKRVSKEQPSYFITTPIFYVNDVPHIGHLYTATIADTMARWKRLKGRKVIFSTGTDEHGLKIQKATTLHKTPRIHCDHISKEFQTLFTNANISHTDFTRTTDPTHKKLVQRLWLMLFEKGYIYKGTYSGWYCLSDEVFLTEDQITEVKGANGQPIKVSAESGHPVEWLEEENYMFQLSKFRDRLLEWVGTGVIKPAQFGNLVTLWLKDDLQDLSISRSTKRLQWGIIVPNDTSQVIYVWLDALVNYLTAVGYPTYHSTWPPDCQVIGKDILRFHAIYWPAFLMALGLKLPRQILCHSHWLVDGVKMSKSLGNVIDPSAAMADYSVDGLRYFLVREATPHSDANYSAEKVMNILNSELANTLGNLLSRCTSTTVNPKQTFPKFNNKLFDETASAEHKQMLISLKGLPDIVDEHFEEYNIYKGIDAIMSQLRLTQGFIEHLKPWELCQEKDKVKELNNVLYVVMETLRTCGILLQPVIPDLSQSLLGHLNIPKDQRMFTDTCKRSTGGWDIVTGIYGVLFKRIPDRNPTNKPKRKKP